MEENVPKYTQIEGIANIGENKSILFTSTEAIPYTVVKFRTLGCLQCMSDGSFDFTPKPRKQSKSVRIKKVAHGSLSSTKDGAILLWIKVYKDEGIDIAATILDEAKVAAESLTI